MRGKSSWKRTAATTASLLVFLAPASGYAKQCKEPVRVSKPCVGDLLPISLSAKGLSCLKTSKKKCDAKLAHAKEVCAAEKKSLVAQVTAEKKRGDEYKTLLDQHLAKKEQVSLLDSRELWFGAGVLLGFGGAVAIVYLTK